jgi:hypothetical protein
LIAERDQLPQETIKALEFTKANAVVEKLRRLEEEAARLQTTMKQAIWPGSDEKDLHALDEAVREDKTVSQAARAGWLLGFVREMSKQQRDK